MTSNEKAPLGSPEPTKEKSMISTDSGAAGTPGTLQALPSETGEGLIASLIESTSSPQADVRRQAAQQLGDLRARTGIPALIGLLTDEAFEVRWRAAESLVKLEKACLVPLLEELVRAERFDSIWFLEGVHHVFRKLAEEGLLDAASERVLEAFDAQVAEVSVPEAAERALEALNSHS
jgi:HEAT repeat protein